MGLIKHTGKESNIDEGHLDISVLGTILNVPYFHDGLIRSLMIERFLLGFQNDVTHH